MIQNHTFVGMADATLALIQHGTRLYLVDTTAITKEMLYQQVSFPGSLVEHALFYSHSQALGISEWLGH